MRFQVSGHTPILHPVGDATRSYKPYNATEHAVYERLASDASLAPLYALVPRFYGVARAPAESVAVDGTQQALKFSKQSPTDSDALARKMTLAEGGQAVFVVLETVGCEFAHPCIADFKLGLAEEACRDMRALDRGLAAFSEEKLRWKAQKAQRSTTAALACRLCGMLLWDPAAQQHVFRSKYSDLSSSSTGSSSVESAKAVLRESVRPLFTDTTTGAVRTAVLEECLRQLQHMRTVVGRVDSCPFLLWSTSLLVAFDGDLGAQEATVRMKLLDFGRVVPLDTAELRVHFGKDGVALGLANLADVLQSLLDQRP